MPNFNVTKNDITEEFKQAAIRMHKSRKLANELTEAVNAVRQEVLLQANLKDDRGNPIHDVKRTYRCRDEEAFRNYDRAVQVRLVEMQLKPTDMAPEKSPELVADTRAIDREHEAIAEFLKIIGGDMSVADFISGLYAQGGRALYFEFLETLYLLAKELI